MISHSLVLQEGVGWRVCLKVSVGGTVIGALIRESRDRVLVYFSNSEEPLKGECKWSSECVTALGSGI